MRHQPREVLAMAAALLALTAGCRADDPDSDSDRSREPTSSPPSATLFSPPSGPITQPAFRPREGLILASIPTGSGTGPSGISLGHGSVWVTTHRSAELLRIDPRTHKIVARIPIPEAHGRLEAAPVITPNAVMLCVFERARVARVDPRTNRLRVRRGVPCDALEHGELGTWLAGDDRLTQIDPVSLRTIRVLRPQGLVRPLNGDVVQAGGSLWVSIGNEVGELYRIHPRSAAVLGHWSFGDGNFSLARIGRWVYFTNPASDEVSIVDVSTNKVIRTRTVPGSGAGDPILTAGHGQLWASAYDGGLARLDPKTLKVIASGQLGSQDYVGEVAVGKGRIWYPTYGGDTVLEVRSRF